MQYEKKIIEVGGSQGILLPLDLCNFLQLQVGDTVVIQDEKGKKGNYLSIWKKEEVEK